jgi:hypothetical protein
VISQGQWYPEGNSCDAAQKPTGSGLCDSKEKNCEHGVRVNQEYMEEYHVWSNAKRGAVNTHDDGQQRDGIGDAKPEVAPYQGTQRSTALVPADRSLRRPELIHHESGAQKVDITEKPDDDDRNICRSGTISVG